jgi:hypothetical protein
VDDLFETVTLLGGIGDTWEHDAHLYCRRAIGLRTIVDGSGMPFQMIMNGPGAVHSSLPFARRCRLVEEGPGREVEPAIPHR